LFFRSRIFGWQCNSSKNIKSKELRLILVFHRALERLKDLDYLGILLLRLYLFTVFWSAGTRKVENFSDFSSWLEKLGFPFSDISTYLLISVELGGAALVLVGLLVRWACIPLLITMGVVIFVVQWENGWAQESNGIEMAVTYSTMLLILLFSGGGRYFSLDYWITRY
jgi:uncharacterized membrane protein YphA (DoxX/SURF4 family)